jgi:hypothetical protein
MSEISKEDRENARRIYEETGNISEVQRQTGISRPTIRKIMREELWTFHPPFQEESQPFQGTNCVSVQQKAQAEVISIATRQVIENAQTAGLVDQQVDFIEESLKAHGELSAGLLAYAKEILADARSGNYHLPKGHTTAQYAHDVAELIAKAISTSREAAGLKSGQMSSLKSTMADEPIRIEQRKLETVKINVDARGRKIEDAA